MDSGMGTATSADGTQIAYQRQGSGPAVVLVGGGLDDGSENAVLMPALASEFTVYNYVRRGRGGSGDTQPYAVHREVEDLAAVLDAAGGKAHVFGASSGGALALEAAAAGLPIVRLAVYDVPYSVAEDAVERWRTYRADLDEALAERRIDDALAAFMRLGGASDDDLAGARAAPFWDGLLALAPTLAYDAAVLGDGGPPSGRLANIGQETLVLTRSTSDPYMPALPVEFFAAAADAVASALPHVKRRTINAPGHAVDAAAVASPVRAFFAGLGSRLQKQRGSSDHLTGLNHAVSSRVVPLDTPPGCYSASRPLPGAARGDRPPSHRAWPRCPVSLVRWSVAVGGG